MYERFLAEEPPDGNHRSPGIHAAECSGCERKVVYSILKTERRDEAAPVWRKRFKIGHAIHDMFQKDFERMMGRKDFSISFVPEVNIDPECGSYNAAKWDIYSHTDGIFVIHDLAGNPLIRVVLEIKTASPGEFEKLKAPEEAHVEQAHVYMACLDVPLTWFLYYNKGNQNYTGSDNPSFFIKYNPKIWADLEARFERMHIAAATGELPDRVEGIVCEFCAFAHTCNPKILMRRQGVHQPHAKWAVPR
jgi:hypothetical protein